MFYSPCVPTNLPTPSISFPAIPPPSIPLSPLFPIFPHFFPPRAQTLKVSAISQHFSIHCLSHIEIYRVIVRDRQVHPRKSFTFPSTSHSFPLTSDLYIVHMLTCVNSHLCFIAVLLWQHIQCCVSTYIYIYPVVPINLPHSFLLPPIPPPSIPLPPLPHSSSQSPNLKG